MDLHNSFGYACSALEYASEDEIVYICGNALVIQRLQSSSQRVIRGTSFGIQGFAVNRKHGLVALAEKGPNPAIHVHSVRDLQLLGSLRLDFPLGYTCLALSADGERLAVCGEEPHARISVYAWREAEHIVTADLPPRSGTATSISFHPYDGDRLAATLNTMGGQGSTHVWHIERLWDRCEISSKKVLTDVAHPTSTHCWYPGGLYVGTSTGHLYAALVPRPPLPPAPPAPHSTAPSTRPGISRAISTISNAGSAYARTDGAEDGEEGGGEEEERGEGGDQESAPRAPEGWQAQLMMDVWGTGSTPITALTVSRDVVVVGGPEEVIWLTHPQVTEGEEGEGETSGDEREGKGHKWGMKRCGFYEVGLGSGVVALVYGRYDAQGGQVAVGTGDGRVLVLELGDMVGAMEAGEQQRQQQQQQAAQAQEPQPQDEEALDSLMQQQQQQQQHQQQQQQHLPLPKHEADTGSTYLGIPPQGVRVLVDSHVGRVSGLAAHLDGSGFVSCGADGTVRLWGLRQSGDDSRALGGVCTQLLARRAFSSAQTCLSVAPVTVNSEMALVGVGSETGVLRLLALPSAQKAMAASEDGGGTHKRTSVRQIQVLWRRRLHQAPLHSVAFSPDGAMLATAGKDNKLWFLSLNRDGTALPLGQVICPGEILCITWPEVHGVDDGVLVSLAAGAIACVRAPIELHAASRPTANEGLMLGPPDISTHLVRVESPLLSMVPVAGPQYGEVYGLGADQMVHRVVLPQDNHDWTGLRARPLRSLRRVCVHQRHQSAICATPNGRLIATGGIDGTLVLLDPALNVLGGLAGVAGSTPGSQPHSNGSGLADSTGEPGRPDSAIDEKAVGEEGEAEEGEEGRNPGYKGPLVTGIHDVLSQGVAAAAFDTRGRYLVSCGHDGSIFTFRLLIMAHITDQEVSSMGSLVVPGVQDADAFDEEGEAGEAESAAASRPTSNAARQRPGPAPGGPPIEKRLRALQDALAECVARNQSVPDLEKVPRTDFIIDRALLKELKAKADAAVKDSRVVAAQEGLIMEVTAARIRAMCWDAMLVRGQHIMPIMPNKSSDAGGANAGQAGTSLPEAVHNFPLLEDTKRKRQLAQLSFLRQVEIVEWGDTGAAYEEMRPPRLNAEGSSRSLVSAQSEAPSPKGPPPTGTLAPKGGSLAAGATPEPDHGSEGGTSNRQSTTDLGRSLGRDRWAIQDINGLMYSSFDLYSPTRKVTQAHFLIQKAQDLKIEFNNDWERLSRQKVSDVDKITDLNARLEDVLSDLEKLDIPVQQPAEQLKIAVTFPEDMSNVLTVVDEEVKDCIKTGVKESGGPEEGGGNSMGEGADAALDRGLRQMMGGTLASKQNKEQTYTLVKPDWMDGNPAFFTEMQQKEVQEFKKKERQLAEERTKRVNMLEVELRTLRSGLEALASQFNSNFKELASKRHVVAADIGAYEVAVLSLAAALEAASEAGEHKEQEVHQAMASANDTRTKVAIELSSKRRALTDVEAPLPELYAQEKLLDRNFRKEFADAQQHLGRLLQLYRMRVVAGHSPAREISQRHSAAHSQQQQQQQLQGSGLSPHAAAGAAASSTQQANSSPVHEGGRQPRTHRQSQTFAGKDSASQQPMQPAITDDRPVSPLSVLLHHPLLEDVQGTTSDPWPDLPQPLATTIISSAQPPGTLPPGAPREPETLGEQYKPEGLDADLWNQFESHRGARVRGEAEVARLEACCSILRHEIQTLDAAAAAATKASAEAMQKIQALQDARQAALLDAELQLRLKAGQLEVGLSSGSKEAGGLLAGTADALFVHRSVVEALNEQIRQRAVRNVEVLHAIKEFKKNIHLLEWDHKRCDTMVADIGERIRELQLLHVTRDMHAVFREGEAAASGTAAAAAAETNNLEAFGKQIEKLRKKATQERLHELKLINTEIIERTNRNAEIGRHLTGLSQVVEEQRRLRASMGSMDDGVRRMRSLVTHKKLKDIALAQADEVRALASELDHLRQHTYPTFIEPSPAGVADVRVDPQRASLRAPGGSLRGKHLTKSFGRLF